MRQILFLLAFLFCKIAKCVRDPHYEMSLDKNAERHKNGLVKAPPTHKYLNAVRKWKNDPYVGKIMYSYGHLPYVYNNRDEVDKLIQQRDKHENKTEMYLKAGKILHKQHGVISGLIIDRAKKHRGKAQKVQEELDKERSKAKVVSKPSSWRSPLDRG